MVGNAGPSLRILITNIQLKARSGTEIVTMEMARGLARRGHEVVVFSPDLGDSAQALRCEGVRVTDRLDELDFRPDVIHGNHSVDLVHGLIAFPHVPSVFVCHNSEHWICSPPDLSRVRAFVSVDRLGRERIARELPRAHDHIQIIHNAVDLERFASRAPLPPRPVKALMLTKFPTAVAEVRAACTTAGLDIDVVGSGVDNVVDDLPERLKRADIVFASARMAIEAMAVGCAVVVVDGRGLAGLVTPDVVATWRDDNFGRVTLKQPVTAEALTEEIARYDATAAAVVAEDVRRNHALDRALSIYESIYRDAIANNGTINSEDEARELSRLMRCWLPMMDGESPIRAHGLEEMQGVITNRIMVEALQRSETDSAARLQQIHTLTDRLRESEHDRSLRLEQIHTLTKLLAESERERSRLQHANTSNPLLQELERDRVLKLEQINTLTRLFQESEHDRSRRLEQIDTLTQLLKESEHDRSQRLEQINTLTRLLHDSEHDRSLRLEQIHTLTSLLGRSNRDV